MAIEEYWVITNVESDRRSAPLAWNGAEAGEQLNDPKTSEWMKRAHVTVVEANSAENAIHGVRQLMPGSVQGKSYAILKSSLTSI